MINVQQLCFFLSFFLFVILIRIIKNGQTALHYAKDVDMAKLLVENKGDLLAKDEVRMQYVHSFVCCCLHIWY